MPLERVGKYWRSGEEGFVVCDLCPHACRIAEGRAGACKARHNEGAKLGMPYYGLVSSLAIDPIEKKPLHHFLPGSSVFSVGFVGCNLRCPFCQNWRISQETPSELEEFSPETLVDAALRSATPSIAYTYAEPTVHFEFLRACMVRARQAGLKNVLVTNGCIKAEPGRELLELCDAVNVDLKTWDPGIYRYSLGGDLDAVLDFLRIASKLCHLEVTTLVVPGISDSLEGIDGISAFIASLSPRIPLHLSAYHPAWKYKAPPTEAGLVSDLASRARAKLIYVYIGNLVGSGEDSYCPSCGARVIARRGYSIDTRGLKKTGGRAFCQACNSALDIIV
jgi:pyruvate formate lyase activating enzyme